MADQQPKQKTAKARNAHSARYKLLGKAEKNKIRRIARGMSAGCVVAVMWIAWRSCIWQMLAGGKRSPRLVSNIPSDSSLCPFRSKRNGGLFFKHFFDIIHALPNNITTMKDRYFSGGNSEKPKASFKSLKEMAAALVEPPEKRNRNLFERVLKGKFADFDGVKKWPLLQSSIRGVQGTRFYRTPEMGDSVNVEITYSSKDGKERKELGSIGSGGILSLKLPPHIERQREELYAELLSHVDALNPRFWIEVNSAIPADETGATREHGTPSEHGTERALDPVRLQVLSAQPDALFGVQMRDPRGKETGYYGVFFKNMLVLDNPRVGNAAFVRVFDTPLGEQDVELAEKRSGKEELVARLWEPYAGKNRRELVEEAGFTRVVHPPMEDQKWAPQMIEILNQHSPRADRFDALSAKESKK